MQRLGYKWHEELLIPISEGQRECPSVCCIEVPEPGVGDTTRRRCHLPMGHENDHKYETKTRLLSWNEKEMSLMRAGHDLR